ncbi:hypothetical protein ACOSP7_032190 [Xanthoceras sorbifolium]
MAKDRVRKCEKKTEPYGPWLVVSYGKNRNRNRFNGKRNGGGNLGNESFRYDRVNGNLEGSARNAGGYGAESKSGDKVLGRAEETSGKNNLSSNDACKGIKERDSAKRVRKDKMQNYLKKKPNSIVEMDEDLEKIGVLQQLHRDVVAFKGLENSNHLGGNSEANGDSTISTQAVLLTMKKLEEVAPKSTL